MAPYTGCETTDRAGRRMKVVFYGIAAVLGALGLVFLLGAQGVIMRMVIGVVLFVAAGAMIYLAQARPVHTTLSQKIDLSGDVSTQRLACQSCGAALSQKHLSVKAGAIFVNCEYCGAVYQLEEAPKW